MEIKPIQNEKDYEEALSFIEDLWNAKLGTPEGDKLEILMTLVEAYEQKKYPILPPDPIKR
ncbi:MAG TPA: hypothetical protein DF383_04485 [Deltaproteobacteria bacterium]|nr:hypothetical protein [Deltaproteobacteria bacterium]